LVPVCTRSIVSVLRPKNPFFGSSSVNRLPIYATLELMLDMTENYLWLLFLSYGDEL
jgi:hypothetical protein